MCTGDFGTNARHPRRERIDSPISNFLPRVGVAALPYTESSTSAEHVIIASNGAFPCGRTRQPTSTQRSCKQCPINGCPMA